MNGLIPLAAIATLAVSLPQLASAQMQDQQPASPPASDQGMAPTQAESAASAGANTSTGPIPADQLPAGQASALANGDNQMVTNGPVPDTPANRAKYGGPMSRAGRHTKPAGN
ncbi:MAG TPA: hypothetical protein VIC25_04435 [Caulobacteraceae bacterium]